MSRNLVLDKYFDIIPTCTTEHDFYMNVHRYFDYNFTHPELADIYEKAGREYRKKNTNIWAEYDRRHDTTCVRQRSELSEAVVNFVNYIKNELGVQLI